jgi:hypothetical protein
MGAHLGTKPARSRPRLWTTSLWFSVVLLILGILIEYYAHALGAFILSDCDTITADNVSRCAQPRRLAIIGFVVIGLGAAGILVRLVLGRSRRA